LIIVRREMYLFKTVSLLVFFILLTFNQSSLGYLLGDNDGEITTRLLSETRHKNHQIMKKKFPKFYTNENNYEQVVISNLNLLI